MGRQYIWRHRGWRGVITYGVIGVKTARELNHDLDIICQWAHQWKMEFNPDPTMQATEVLFSCKKSSPNHPQLIFNGTVVTKVNEQKHLGLILDSGLSFEKHLNAKG